MKLSWKKQSVILLKTVLLLVLNFSYTLNGSTQVKFYVSPLGNDLNPGSAKQPFATLTAARNAIREHKQDAGKPVSYIISISDGVFSMTEPFVLSPEDSGTPGYPVIYRAEKGANPIFTGGKKISGFKIHASGIWEAHVPDVKSNTWRFDQLYVNNKRATLARTPNKGFLKIKGVKENIWIQGAGRVPEKAQQIFTFDDHHFQSLANLNEDDLELLRFRAFHKWDFTMRRIDGVYKENRAVFTSGKGMKPWNPIKKNGRLVLENYAAALDTAGEWFLNTNGTLQYFPLPGQTPENTEVIAPVLENLISIKGDISNNKYVEYITFEGITFNYCHYSIPAHGFEPNQAAISIHAAIWMEKARHITFSDCEVSHTGQHAIWFGTGCNNSKVSMCYLHNLGGGGIYLGDNVPSDSLGNAHHILLENNIIHSGGKEFPPAVGIWVGHSSDNTIIHNDIADFYYTGISVGWVWGYQPSLSKRNNIIFNHIHHIGWDLLSDMAAVYTLGRSEGTIISNNVIHHIHAYSYGGWGLYTDEGSSDIRMENNLVYHTKTGGFHQHYGKNNIIKNNIFAYSNLYQAQCTRVEDHRSFNFNNNIIVFDKGVVLKGPWSNIDISMDNNLYWNVIGSTYDFSGKTFEEWQQSGHDRKSLIGNPNFKDVQNLDFRFKNRKAIKKINFKPFNYSKAGVYGNKEWREKAILPGSITEAFDIAVEKNLNRE